MKTGMYNPCKLYSVAQASKPIFYFLRDTKCLSGQKTKFCINLKFSESELNLYELKQGECSS